NRREEISEKTRETHQQAESGSDDRGHKETTRHQPETGQDMCEQVSAGILSKADLLQGVVERSGIGKPRRVDQGRRAGRQPPEPDQCGKRYKTDRTQTPRAT